MTRPEKLFLVNTILFTACLVVAFISSGTGLAMIIPFMLLMFNGLAFILL